MCDRFTFEELSNMSLDELLSDPVDDVPYEHQVMVTLVQTLPTGRIAKGKMVDPLKVKSVMAVARNSRCNCYIQSRLDTSLHLSTTMAHLFFICQRLSEINGSIVSRRTITYISPDTEYWRSEDGRTIVRNHVPHSQNVFLNAIIHNFEVACKNGALCMMKFSEKKRTSQSYDGHTRSPVMHTGFTQSNAHQYKNSRITQLGHTGPSLITSYLQEATPACKKAIAATIALGNFLFKDSPSCFRIEDADHPEIKKRMRDQYLKFWGVEEDAKENKIFDHLTNQASTMFPNPFINAHYDTKNDNSDGFCGVVVVNVCLDRSKNFPMDERFGKWLDSFGYKKYFPMCNVAYARKVCHDVCRLPTQQLKMIESMSTNRGMAYLASAIADAVTDVNSETNFQGTFYNMAGIDYECLASSVDQFNSRQRKLYNVAKNVGVSSIYSKYFSKMGPKVIENIQKCAEAASHPRFNNLSSEESFSWIQLSRTAPNTRKSLPIIPDPQTTYQGPVISLRAAYCKNRYYSAILDAFADINSNMSPMNEVNSLGFAIFCTIQSNGTLAISEVLRNMAGDSWEMSRNRFEDKYRSSLWDMLIDIAKDTSFTCVGSCSNSRCQINTAGEIFEFHRHSDFILSLFKTVKEEMSIEEMQSQVIAVKKSIVKHVLRVGPITALWLIQCSSLIGLLPLKVATLAHVENGGPAKLMKLANPTLNVEDTFNFLHHSFSEIWGPRFTMAYLENLLCELFRELQQTIGYKKHFGSPEAIRALCNSDESIRKKPSPQKDTIAIYLHRGIEHCIPSMFSVEVDDNGNASLQMQMYNLDVSTKTVLLGKSVRITSFNDASVQYHYNFA